MVGPARKSDDLGAKGDKKCIRIKVKIKIDFEVDFGLKMEPQWSPKGAKMEAKWEKNRSKIDVKFEVDFGCDFVCDPGINGTPPAECADGLGPIPGIPGYMFSTPGTLLRRGRRI